MFIFGFTKFHIEVAGFGPMALCAQNRCANQTALHLVSPPLIPMKILWMLPDVIDEHEAKPLACWSSLAKLCLIYDILYRKAERSEALERPKQRPALAHCSPRMRK